MPRRKWLKLREDGRKRCASFLCCEPIPQPRKPEIRNAPPDKEDRNCCRKSPSRAKCIARESRETGTGITTTSTKAQNPDCRRARWVRFPRRLAAWRAPPSWGRGAGTKRHHPQMDSEPPALERLRSKSRVAVCCTTGRNRGSSEPRML